MSLRDAGLVDLWAMKSDLVEVEQPHASTSKHPYNTGNFRPLHQQSPLTACSYTGSLPAELSNGIYVRNGGNASASLQPSEAFHWFDGFGALAGVYFKSVNNHTIQPEFVAKWVVTDLYAEQQHAHSRLPVIPSIATLIAPLWYLPILVWSLLRAVLLVILSFVGPSPIRRISVANTSVLYHDGRALATCESGPPMWVSLPDLGTVGWWGLEGDAPGEVGLREAGGGGLLGMANEWTTAHPKRDNHTGELILYHSSFFPPYLKYSVIPSTGDSSLPSSKRILATPLPIPSARMMHDFAASRQHTVILDCPLSLDPLQILKGKPTVNFSPYTPTRLGVFPRHAPEEVTWYNTQSCIVFHTANAWSEEKELGKVNMLCCRMNSPRMIYAAGNLDSVTPSSGPAEVCELYYYQLDTSLSSGSAPTHAFSLSTMPFEFPELSSKTAMDAARYVYGCSLTTGTFSAALGKASKIDCLVKMDVLALAAEGRKLGLKSHEAVDHRSIMQVLKTQQARSLTDLDSEPIRVFSLPEHHCAQECSFVPRSEQRGEDDGYLLFYVFDERQLDEQGEPSAESRSELWIVDAWDMQTVVAKVHLPQRVPYGLHGEWFSAEEVAAQRPITQLRTVDHLTKRISSRSWTESIVSCIQHLLD